MVAISRNRIKIWIVPTGTNASTLLMSGTTALAPLVGEIRSYNKTGGERDVETVPVFGGNVDKDKPISQVELAFEILPDLDNAARWDAFAYKADTANPTVYTLAADPDDRAVFIQAFDGTTKFYSWGFNNCNATMLDIEHEADDNQTQTFNLKFAPTTARGVSNFMSKAAAVTTLPNWSALDNN